MKKVLIVLLILCSIDTYAQNFEGGVILGISSSQVSGDNLGGFNKAGILTGAFVNRKINFLLKLQMEITYIQKGSNNPNMNNADHPNYNIPDISSSYIEIPLLLKYQQNNLLQIEGGILYGELLNAHYKDSFGEIKNNGSPPFIDKDFGLLLGINYKYSKRISLNTRVCNSIIPIGSEDYQQNAQYNSSRKGKYNSVLSFSLHYNF